MSRRVIVARGFEQHQIRLWLRVFVKLHGVLHGDKPLAFAEIGEEAVEAFRHAPVKWSDGRHINDLSVEQFHARVWPKHAGLGHAVVFLHAETMLCLNRHKGKITNHSDFRNLVFASTWATSLSPRAERFIASAIRLRPR